MRRDQKKRIPKGYFGSEEGLLCIIQLPKICNRNSRLRDKDKLTAWRLHLYSEAGRKRGASKISRLYVSTLLTSVKMCTIDSLTESKDTHGRQ